MNAVPILSGRPDSLFTVNMQTKEVQPTKLHRLIKSGIGIFLLFRSCPDSCPDPEDPKIGTIGKWYVSQRWSKQHYSVILQAIVDCSLKFLHVSVDDPGNIHNARVLKLSELFDLGNNQQILESPSRVIEEIHSSMLKIFNEQR